MTYGVWSSLQKCLQVTNYWKNTDKTTVTKFALVPKQACLQLMREKDELNKIVLSIRWITIKKVAVDLDFYLTVCLDLKRVSVKFVPQFLYYDQKLHIGYAYWMTSTMIQIYERWAKLCMLLSLILMIHLARKKF